MGAAKIGIVEDEFIIAEDLKRILTGMGHEVSFIASTAAKAKEALGKDKPYLLLLDIMLKGNEDGITLADFINKNYGIPFLFVTANTDPLTIERASKVYPLGYLLKPFTPADIYSSLSVALANIGKATNNMDTDRKNLVFEDSVFIRDKNIMLKVMFHEMLYFQADGNHVVLNTISRKFIVRKTLKEMESEFPPKEFLRIHKSYIVRASAVTAIDADHVYLDKIKLPVGRAYHTIFSSLNKFER
jgi:DNA-binding LytR/AlgR family response regulator